MRNVAWLVLPFLLACEKKSTPAEQPVETNAAPKVEGPPVDKPHLLLSQAQFEWSNNAPQPGPAKLLMVYPAGEEWKSYVLEDAQSRVFHKAACTDQGLLTIGGTSAQLKTWQASGSGYVGESHWAPKFGGKWDRLRDFELADMDSDDQDELVIATHDQGVIGLGEFENGRWQVEEIYRSPDTFIHEIELGDLDRDAKIEIYATPSKPNKADHSQGGSIVAFRRVRHGVYKPKIVEAFTKRHAKEILVANVEGDAKPELYASIEAESKKVGGKRKILEPLEIKQYVFEEGAWRSKVIGKFPLGLQARVILAADVLGKGSPQLVVTTMKDGVWLLEPPAKPGRPWSNRQIFQDSTGFEHAAGAFDLDGDGKTELYVAADDQDVLRKLTYNGKTFDAMVIYTLEKSDITWSIEACNVGG